MNIFDSDASSNRVPGWTGVPLARSASPPQNSSSVSAPRVTSTLPENPSSS